MYFKLYLVIYLLFITMNKLKKILITGESGFIGSHLIKHFVCKYPNYIIHGLDSLTYAANKDFTKDLVSHPNYFFHQIDIRNRNDLIDFFINNQISDVEFYEIRYSGVPANFLRSFKKSGKEVLIESLFSIFHLLPPSVKAAITDIINTR